MTDWAFAKNHEGRAKNSARDRAALLYNLTAPVLSRDPWNGACPR